MTKSDIETIIMQDEEIKRLRKRVRELESGYLGMCRQNDRLRARIEKIERRIPHPRLQGGVSRLVVECIVSIFPEGLHQPTKRNMPDAIRQISSNTWQGRLCRLLHSAW